MEDSGSMKKPVPNDKGDGGVEESGCTTYLQDFSRNSDDREDSFFFSSLISDAASCAIHGDAVAITVPEALRGLSMIKRTRKREITDEDPLEDTATSPANSPNSQDQSSKADGDDGHPDDSGGASERCMGMKVRESNDSEKMMYSGDDGQHLECSSLRKRGLCLPSTV